MKPAVAAIQSCEWLFLRSIEEPQENALRVVVEEARASAPADPKAVAAAASLPELEPILQGARLISHSDGCRVFAIAWGGYIAYSVRNESFVTNDKSEQWEGRLLVKYSNSRFLDYVERGTFATAEYPGPFAHWGIICGNHIIDVVSTEEPEVTVLKNGA
jgi:hypothetical protein